MILSQVSYPFKLCYMKCEVLVTFVHSFTLAYLLTYTLMLAVQRPYHTPYG